MKLRALLLAMVIAGALMALFAGDGSLPFGGTAWP
jgi:hypothetical protein